jgi:hypothetical protein
MLALSTSTSVVLAPVLLSCLMVPCHLCFLCVRRLAQEAKALMVPTVEDVFHADTLSTDDYLGEIQSMTILTAIQVRSAQCRQLLKQAENTAHLRTKQSNCRGRWRGPRVLCHAGKVEVLLQYQCLRSLRKAAALPCARAFALPGTTIAKNT